MIFLLSVSNSFFLIETYQEPWGTSLRSLILTHEVCHEVKLFLFHSISNGTVFSHTCMVLCPLNAKSYLSLRPQEFLFSPFFIFQRYQLFILGITQTSLSSSLYSKFTSMSLECIWISFYQLSHFSGHIELIILRNQSWLTGDLKKMTGGI